MSKYISILALGIFFVSPVQAQQKLLTPEFSIKREFPQAPTQETLGRADADDNEAVVEPIFDLNAVADPLEEAEVETQKDAEKDTLTLDIFPSKGQDLIGVPTSNDFMKKDSVQKNKTRNRTITSLGNIDIIRGLVWGISKENVKNYEKIIPVGEDEKSLFYVDDVFTFKSAIGYEFHNDKLWRAQIINEKYYFDPLERIPDIVTIQTLLEEKFGEPTSENFIWLNDTEKDFPQFWGWAIYRGELKISVIWEFEDTQIKLNVDTPLKYKPKISVDYISKKYRPVVKKRNILEF